MYSNFQWQGNEFIVKEHAISFSPRDGFIRKSFQYNKMKLESNSNEPSKKQYSVTESDAVFLLIYIKSH